MFESIFQKQKVFGARISRLATVNITNVSCTNKERNFRKYSVVFLKHFSKKKTVFGEPSIIFLIYLQTLVMIFLYFMANTKFKLAFDVVN